MKSVQNQRLQECDLLLLYIFSNKEKFNINDVILKEIINFLSVFFVRRNITDIPNTRNLIKIFMDAIDLVKNKKNNEITSTIKEHLKI